MNPGRQSGFLAGQDKTMAIRAFSALPKRILLFDARALSAAQDCVTLI